MRRDIVVVLDLREGRIRHADLFAFVDERRAAQREEHGRKRLGCRLRVGALREVVVHRAVLVVVLEEDRVPALFCRRSLAG